MTMRFAILPMLALSALSLVSPTSASAAQPSAPMLSAHAHSRSVGFKDDKPRKPTPKPGPRDGSDDDN